MSRQGYSWAEIRFLPLRQDFFWRSLLFVCLSLCVYEREPATCVNVLSNP